MGLIVGRVMRLFWGNGVSSTNWCLAHLLTIARVARHCRIDAAQYLNVPTQPQPPKQLS